MDHSMGSTVWYEEWRRAAIDELYLKNEELRLKFKLGEYERYDFDLGKGVLYFSQAGKSVVSASIQVIGSTAAGKNWLWAWNNASLPELVTEAARKARIFGEENGIGELTSAYLESDLLEDLGWELSAVAARITSAVGAYRAPTKNGFLFVIFHSVSFLQ